MECKFVVGQRIVCVDPNPSWERFRGQYIFPVADHLYTIRDVGPSYYPGGPNICVRLAEVTNPSTANEGVEPNFRANRFRPAIDFLDICKVGKGEKVKT